MTAPRYEIQPIGWVESPLVDRDAAPKQGFEGSPEAWLDRARRDVLTVHPRDDPMTPDAGVFSTRSQDRPNPVGLHRVHVVAVDGNRVRVRDLEALDGTPIVDVKPVLDPRLER